MNCPISSHIAELEEEDLFLKDGTGSLRELLDKREAYDADWEPPGISALQYLGRLRCAGFYDWRSFESYRKR